MDLRLRVFAWLVIPVCLLFCGCVGMFWVVGLHLFRDFGVGLWFTCDFGLGLWVDFVGFAEWWLGLVI